jgi:hypothetical protein
MVIIFTAITNDAAVAALWGAVDAALLPFLGQQVHIHGRS